MVHTVLELILFILTLCGAAYYLLCLGSARSFLRMPRTAPGFMPPVSILKPLKGADPKIYESFRSHCLQDYESYELIFGLSDPADPAMDYVHRLQAEFPEREIKTVICPHVRGSNRKVSNLIEMLHHAKYEYVLVNDSDIRVSSSYLKQVMGNFVKPGVGMVTCLYRGIAQSTLGSKLESIGISTDFTAGVLSARWMENGLHFAMGSTLAMRREALNAIHGFEAVVDYLADDFELGLRISQAGYDVILSHEVVDTFLPKYTISSFFEHQLRWSRSTRDSRRWGYTGMVLTFGLPWAMLLLLIAGGARWSWGLLALLATLRYLVALVVGRGVLRDPQMRNLVWLLPFRDVVALLVWICSFAGNTIVWRGEVFSLEAGKLRPMRTAGKAAAAALVVHEGQGPKLQP